MKTNLIQAIILFLSLFILAGCVSSEAIKFKDQPETQKHAKEMVKKELMKLGLDIETVGEAFYPGGPTAEDTYMVLDYKTLHKPVYLGRADIEVDIKKTPRHIEKVSNSGIILNEDYDLYDKVFEHIFPLAYRSSLNETKQIVNHFPGLEFVDHKLMKDDEPLFIDLKLDKDQFMKRKLLNEFINDYTQDKFNQPNEEEAKQYIEKYMILSVDSIEGTKIPPGIHLEYSYKGIFSNQLMDNLLNELRTIPGLPNGVYTVIVNADGYEKGEAEQGKYNEDLYGNLQPQFAGDFKIDENIK